MPRKLKTRSQTVRPVHRATSAQRGYDYAWHCLRTQHVLEHPLCEDCLEEGVVNPEDIEVDHVIPIEVRPDLRLDPANLRSRCRRHHKLKTNRDKKLYGSRSHRSTHVNADENANTPSSTPNVIKNPIHAPHSAAALPLHVATDSRKERTSGSNGLWSMMHQPDE